MHNSSVVRLTYYLSTYNHHDLKFVANPSLLHPEQFRSEEQMDQLLEMAQVITNKGNWNPSHAMIDKSQAEYNALRNGIYIAKLNFL
jgi:hypothetical protein